MSDYLAHLVGRTQGEGAAVRPRLAGIFEPVSIGASPTAFANAENADENLSPEPVPLLRSRRVREHDEEAKARSLGRETVIREVVRRERILVTPEKSPALLSGIETRAQSAGDPTAGRASLYEQRTETAPGGDRSENVEVSVRQNQKQNRTSPLQPTVQPTVAQNLASQPKVASVLRNADELQRSARVPRSVDLSVPDRADLRAANRVSIQGAIHQQKNSDAEPSIHVSIGRVEIRATTAAAPSRSMVRPPSPVMALDDYLRQRGKRGRE
jgi:hypothetical protein